MERGQRNDIGSWGSFVYFPEQDFTAVTRAMVAVHPPPDAGWGANRSKWKTGSWYVRGRMEIPLEQIVRGAVDDPGTVEVLSPEAGLDLEAEQIT